MYRTECMVATFRHGPVRLGEGCAAQRGGALIRAGLAADRSG